MPDRVTPLVQAVQLEKRYVDGPAEVCVLAGLDLAVERPTAGRVLFDGDDVFARPEAALAAFRHREIGFVFQFHHLLGDFTALENVMLPGLIARRPLAETRARALALLERVGLQDRL